MADERPIGGDGDSGDGRDTPPPDFQLDLARIYQTIIAPQLDAWDRIRRATSGDIDSLAWWTADAPTSPAQAIRDLRALTDRTWNGDGQPIGPRLEEQLWNIHRGINDPDGGLNKVLYDRLSRLAGILEDPDSPQNKAVLNALKELTEAIAPPTKELTGEDLDAAISGGSDGDGGDGGTEDFFEGLKRRLRLMFDLGVGLEKGKKQEFPPQVVAASAAGVASVQAHFEGIKAAGNDFKRELFNQANTGLLDPVAGLFRELLSGFLSAQVASLSDIPGDDPSAARQRASVALLEAMAFGLAAHGVATGIEAVYPTKNLGLNQIAAFLADMSGFQPLSNALWSHLVNEAIDLPLQYGYREQFRQRLPPQGEIFAAARKWEFQSWEEFDGWIAKQGIQPYWSRLMWRYIWADPRLTDIVRMADISLETGTPSERWADDLAHYQVDPNDPDWWLDLKFKKAGYDGIDIPVLKRVVHARMVATYLTRWRTQARETFRKGYWTEDQFRHAMRENGVQADAIEMDVATTKLDRLHVQGDEAVAELRRQYAADVIDEDDFRLGLDVWLDDPAVIDYHVQAVNLQKSRTVAVAVDRETKAATRKAQSELVTAYKEQFKRDLIDADTLFANLVAVGIHEDVARASVEVATVRKQPVPKAGSKTPEQEAQEDARSILEDAYVNQYRAGVIDDAGLQGALIAVGFHELVARAIVDRELSRKVLEARRKADAEAERLKKAADAAEKAKATAAEREAKKVRDDLERRYLSLLVTQYDKGLIDEQTFLARLLKAGWPDATARVIVQREAARKKRDPSLVTDPPFKPR